MLDRFKQYLHSTCKYSGGKILLACSGGVDSMSLARLLQLAEIPFALAHCNYQLRGEDSNTDEAFVRSWAEENKVQLFASRFETKKIQQERSGSIQMVARELRYAWFTELLNNEGFDFLATAHHLDDSIETFFINLKRGTGLSGLSGISAREGQLIRPLLFASKEEIIDFARSEKLSWREDQSNESDNYLRNRIRHHLIPFFKSENENWTEGMAKTLTLLKESEETLHHHYHELDKNLNRNGKYSLKDLRQLSHVSGFLHFILSPLGYTPSQIENIKDSLSESGEKEFLSPYHQLLISGGVLHLDPLERVNFELKIEDWQDLQKIPGVKKLEKTALTAEILSSIKSPAQGEFYLSLEALEFPLTAGNWRKGDRFSPMGLKGSKLLSDYFNDIKLSKIEKESQIILRSSKNDIIWIAGKRLSNAVRVTADTRFVIKLRYELPA